MYSHDTATGRHLPYGITQVLHKCSSTVAHKRQYSLNSHHTSFEKKCGVNWVKVVTCGPPYSSCKYASIHESDLCYDVLLSKIRPAPDRCEISCSATPISYKCEEISRLSHLVIQFPIWAIWGYFGEVWAWGIWLLPVQNLASYSCSATPISYKGDEISCLINIHDVYDVNTNNPREYKLEQEIL